MRRLSAIVLCTSTLALAGCGDRSAPAIATTAPPPSAPVVPESELPPEDFHELDDTDIEVAVLGELALDRAVGSTEIDVDVTDGIVALTGTVASLIARERAARIAEAVKGVRSVSNQIEVKPIPRSDEQIAEDVRTRMLLDPAVAEDELDVGVDAGVVTLRGTADSWYEGRHAARVAAAVKGVRAVDNEIEVVYQSERSDADIAGEIRSRLRWDVLVDDGLIDVAVEDGAVTLTGVVGSAAERTRAFEGAWVANVESVDASGLEVRWWNRDPELRAEKYAEVSDPAIAAAIRDAISYDPHVSLGDVDVAVDHGIATLRGRVDRYATKAAAEQIARNTVGVIAVTSEIELDEPRDDEELGAAIEAALALNPITESYEVDVMVEAGAARLVGTVHSFLEKAEAERVALDTRGVWTVDNDIDVELSTPLVTTSYLGPWMPIVHTWTYAPPEPISADPALIDRTYEELRWNPAVTSGDIRVTAENGVVTLSGYVPTRYEKREAAREALEAGAVSVINDLYVE